MPAVDHPDDANPATGDADDPPIPVATRPWESHADGELRIAVVGLGWWTREYALPAIAATGNCRATVAVSGSPDKRAAVAADGTVTRTLDYDAFVAGKAVEAYDAAYVSTPNARHLPMARAAAAHGRHVLCEKPLEASGERAESLVDACADADVRLMAAYRLQTDPAIWRLARRVRDGLVGDPLAIHADMSQPLLSFFESPDQWRLDPSLVGPGSSVIDIGIYPINTTRYLTGLDPVAVTGATWSGSEPFASVPDERAAFRLAFPDGVFAQCSVSQNGPLTGSFRLVGTDGHLALTPAFFGNERTDVRVSTPDVDWRFSYTPVDQMRELFAFFADRTLADEPFVAGGEHALRDVRIVEGIYRAAETGRAVDVTR